jgi:hypothetical protein
VISHWDDVRTWRGERGHIAGTWSSLTGCSSRSEITLLMCGTGDPGDSCFDPRSGKVFRRLGLFTRVGEQLDVWERED